MFEIVYSKVLVGDVMDKIAEIPDKSIDCCVTSPPYYGLRDYGVSEQIGLESTPEEYVDRLVKVFREVKRGLKDDGTLWVNIGDSYAGIGKRGGGDPTIGMRNLGVSDYPPKNLPNSCKPKDIIGIPWMLAFALRNDGWWLRQDIIWHRPNCMPESVRDRCVKAHEYIFLLSKSRKYHFDHEAIKEPCVNGDPTSPRGSCGTLTPNAGRRGSGNKERKQRPSADVLQKGTQAGGVPWEYKEFRNKRSVWSVNIKPVKYAHFATFPVELITPCILAGCPEGGVVLDPFAGSGTTGKAANDLGRNFIGIELNPKYVEIMKRRIGDLEVAGL